MFSDREKLGDNRFKVELEQFRDRKEVDNGKFEVKSEPLPEEDFEVKLEPILEDNFEVKFKPSVNDDDDLDDVETGRMIGPVEACLIGAGCGFVLSEIVGKIVFGASIGIGRHHHYRARNLPDEYAVMVVICLFIGAVIGYLVNRVINGKNEWVHEEEDDEFDKLWK